MSNLTATPPAGAGAHENAAGLAAPIEPSPAKGQAEGMGHDGSAIVTVTAEPRRAMGQRLLLAVEVILCILPLAIFFLDVYQNAVDAPYYDDYIAILDFTNRYVQTDSLSGKLALIFSQHNEHRIVPTRLASLLQYYAFGQINFRQLIILGSTGWVLAVVVLMLGLRRFFKLPAGYLVAIPYFLASAVHHENRLYAMVAIQNYGIILFSLVFLFALAARRSWSYNLVFPVALFTSGGGIILYPLGNLVLLMRKNWRSLLIFFLLSSVFAAAYLYHFQRPATLPPMSQAAIQFQDTLAWFVAFLGGATASTALALPVGLLTCVMLLAILVMRREDDPLFLVAAYILLTAATTTLSRVSLGLDVAVRSAYAMYSLLAWVCIYVFIVGLIKDQAMARKAVLITTGLAMAFFAGFFLKYELTHSFSNWRTDRMMSMTRFTLGDPAGIIALSQDKAAQVLEESQRLGVYDHTKFYKPVPVTAVKPADLPPENPALNYVFDQLTGAYALGWAMIPDADSATYRISLVLAGDSVAFALPTKAIERHDVSLYFKKTNDYDHSGFEGIFPVDQLPSGTYKIGVLIEHNAGAALRWTDKTLTVK